VHLVMVGAAGPGPSGLNGASPGPLPNRPGRFSVPVAVSWDAGGGAVVKDYSDIGRRRAAHRPRVECICQICGVRFISYPGARGCSGACRAKVYRERRAAARGYVKQPERPCPVCGQTFARGRNARYCSAACKQKAVRQRRSG
jgi:hypothetical protein